MKEITYEITLEHEDSEVTEEVKGEPLSKNFALRFIGWESAKYALDHPRTGALIAFVETKAKARQVVKILEKDMRIDWANWDYSTIKTEIIERGYSCALVDLAMDGLIYAPSHWIDQQVAELTPKGWKHTCYQKIHLTEVKP